MKELSRRFESLKAIIIKHQASADAWVEALLEVKHDELYLEECDSWDQWCVEHVGKTASALRSLLWRQSVKKAQRTIAETTGEKITPRAFAANALIPDTKQNNNNLRTMPARQDISFEVEHVRPPEPPKPLAMPIADRAATRIDVRHDLSEALRDVNRLMHDANMPIGAMRLLGDCCRRLMNVQRAIQGVLPGFEEVMTPPTKARASVEECIEYARVIGLNENDGRWFFDGRMAMGWKNGGRPIVDWKATMRTWKAQGDIFPSHKSRLRAGGANHAPSPDGLTPADRKLARMHQRVMEGKDI